MAGGRGTRLQHITTALGEPKEKQFCRIGSERSLLQHTVERFAPLVRSTTVVVRRDHREMAARQLASHSSELVAQPCDRGTGVGALMGLLALRRQTKEGVVIMAPADHAFADEDVLREAIAEAIALSRRDLVPVLIGAEADAPRTDYGWILPGDQCEGPPSVREFVEKPPHAEAVELHRRGALYNTMILVSPVRELMLLFGRGCPTTLQRLHAALQTGSSERFERVFTELAPVDFSREVLARARRLRVATLPEKARWTDLGDERRLLEWLAERGRWDEAETVRALCHPTSGVRLARPDLASQQAEGSAA